MKKQSFRISLFPNSNQLCSELAVSAAKSNGSESNKITLQDLEAVAKIEKLKYPVSNDNVTVSVIGNKLLLDVKIGDTYQPALEIESVELLELPKNDFEEELSRELQFNPDNLTDILNSKK